MVKQDDAPGELPVVGRVKVVEAENLPPEEAVSKSRATPRKRVTPEEIEAKFKARREERAARKASRTPRDMGKVARMVTASALGLGILGFGLGISTSGDQHRLEVQANESKADSLAGALERLSPLDSEGAKQNLAKGLGAAQKRSDELAAVQQEFSVIAFAGNTEPSTDDGRPKPAVLKSLDHRKVVAGFFAPASLILTDEQAYTFRTDDLVGPGKIDPRQPWFTRYEPAGEKGATQQVADPAGSTWKTASVTLSGTPDVLSTVWTHTNVKTGELLAWATARYSVKTNTFSNLVVNTTTQGDSQKLKAVTATGSTKGANT